MKVVNLRQARKRKAKANASKQAEANRIAHGLSAQERKDALKLKSAQTAHLDAHRLDRDD
ncbi:MAG: DUF4169 family protein [Pseudomonadota bacterium]